MIELISLEEHNRRRLQYYFRSGDSSTGIACPQCGKELHEAFPGVTLTSHPPQKDLTCLSCGYRGRCIA